MPIDSDKLWKQMQHQTYGANEIICPYCGGVIHLEVPDPDLNEDSMSCENEVCGKDFFVSGSLDVCYTAWRTEDDDIMEDEQRRSDVDIENQKLVDDEIRRILLGMGMNTYTHSVRGNQEERLGKCLKLIKEKL